MNKNTISCNILLSNKSFIELDNAFEKKDLIYDYILNNDSINGSIIYSNLKKESVIIEVNLDMFIADLAFIIPKKIILESQINVPIYGYGNILFDAKNEEIEISGENIQTILLPKNIFLIESLQCGLNYLKLLKMLNKEYGIYKEAISDLETRYEEIKKQCGNDIGSVTD
jgi:hypothetical protein